MLIKITRYHSTWIGKSTFATSDHTKDKQECRVSRSLGYTTNGNVKQCIWKIVWKFLELLNKYWGQGDNSKRTGEGAREIAWR